LAPKKPFNKIIKKQVLNELQGTTVGLSVCGEPFCYAQESLVEAMNGITVYNGILLLFAFLILIK
jgi:hypothetical protein